MTALFVKTAKEPGKYFDRHGLFLRVQSSGAKQWVQRIGIGRSTVYKALRAETAR